MLLINLFELLVFLDQLLRVDPELPYLSCLGLNFVRFDDPLRQIHSKLVSLITLLLKHLRELLNFLLQYLNLQLIFLQSLQIRVACGTRYVLSGAEPALLAELVLLRLQRRIQVSDSRFLDANHLLKLNFLCQDCLKVMLQLLVRFQKVPRLAGELLPQLVIQSVSFIELVGRLFLGLLHLADLSLAFL